MVAMASRLLDYGSMVRHHASPASVLGELAFSKDGGIKMTSLWKVPFTESVSNQ